MTENGLSAQDLADFAGAAIRLGRPDLGEMLMAAAYAAADGLPAQWISDILLRLRERALNGGNDAGLAEKLASVLPPRRRPCAGNLS